MTAYEMRISYWSSDGCSSDLGGVGIGQPPRPAVVQRRGRREDDLARHLGLVTLAHEPQFAEVDAVIGIERAHPFERAMDIDRGLPARGAQFGDHPLRLAERIGADEDAAVGLGAHRGEQLGDLVPRGRMAEHRQAEGRLGDDDVAWADFARRAGRVGGGRGGGAGAWCSGWERSGARRSGMSPRGGGWWNDGRGKGVSVLKEGRGTGSDGG